MKKYIVQTIFLLHVFILLPLFSLAATPKCDDVGGAPVTASDPACWTSETTSWTNTCTWSFYRNDYECGPYHHSSQSNCGDDPYCVKKKKCWFHGKVYRSSCGREHCSNDGPVPSAYTETGSSTVYKCYYTTVNTWSTCDVEKGSRYATKLNYLFKEGVTECDNLRQTTTQTCGVCSTTYAGGSGEKPTTDLCIHGTPTPVTLDDTTNEWKWKCLGSDDGVIHEDMSCAAPRNAPGECDPTLNKQTLVSKPDQTKLCSSGVLRSGSFLGGDQGPWSWICDRIGTNEDHPTNVSCSADCFDYTIDVQPRMIYWSENGDDVEVSVSIKRTGVCSSKYSCTITVNEDVVNGDSGTFDISPGSTTQQILAKCSYNGDEREKSDNVTGLCVARSCNAQGTCQSTPQAANSADACTSSCNSDADCSSGRMIETRP